MLELYRVTCHGQIIVHYQLVPAEMAQTPGRSLNVRGSLAYLDLLTAEEPKPVKGK